MGIREIIANQQFTPSLIGLLANPVYFARVDIYDSLKTLASGVRGRILDVGCGSKPYQALFAATEYVGLEIDSSANRSTKKADVFYDGTAFPFPEAAFDAVVSFQVMEHVASVEMFLAEIRRVLKTDGQLLISAPFIWGEHEQPWDYWRFSSFGVKALLEKHGFAVEVQRKTVADIRLVCLLANMYLLKSSAGLPRPIRLLIRLLLMAPLNVLGQLARFILPGNSEWYLDNVILARKIGTEAGGS